MSHTTQLTIIVRYWPILTLGHANLIFWVKFISSEWGSRWHPIVLFLLIINSQPILNPISSTTQYNTTLIQ